MDPNLTTQRIIPGFWSASVKLISVKPQEQIALAPLIAKPYTDTTAAGTIAGTINGTTGSDGNPTFTLARLPASGYPVNLKRNGVALTLTTDYTVSGATLTVLAPNIPITGDGLACDYSSFV
jgi:hypothetical protein